jgi:hypothetical protein
MNLSTFWKRKVATIDLYMKSGAVITLTGVKKFKVLTGKDTGKIIKLEWEIDVNHQRLLDIQVDEIAAIIQRK